MNVPLLRKIIKAIKTKPSRLVMSRWIDDVDQIAACGTAACIGGHALLLSEKGAARMGWVRSARRLITRVGHWPDLYREARGLLQLTPGEARRLFFLTSWPHPFGSDYAACHSREAQAAVAVRRIEHFIKTGE